jgi:hypothetical protein
VDEGVDPGDGGDVVAEDLTQAKGLLLVTIRLARP